MTVFHATLKAIGHVENEFDEATPASRLRSSESTLVLDPELVPGLTGLETGQRILVLFYFHRAEGHELLQHPRGDADSPKRGVFALRSPRRPNPVGVTDVELLAVDENRLRVRGLDALNGTPVLDIKPA